MAIEGVSPLKDTALDAKASRIVTIDIFVHFAAMFALVLKFQSRFKRRSQRAEVALIFFSER